MKSEIQVCETCAHARGTALEIRCRIPAYQADCALGSSCPCWADSCAYYADRVSQFERELEDWNSRLDALKARDALGAQ